MMELPCRSIRSGDGAILGAGPIRSHRQKLREFVGIDLVTMPTRPRVTLKVELLRGS